MKVCFSTQKIVIVELYLEYCETEAYYVLNGIFSSAFHYWIYTLAPFSYVYISFSFMPAFPHDALSSFIRHQVRIPKMIDFRFIIKLICRLHRQIVGKTYFCYCRSNWAEWRAALGFPKT